MIPNIAQIARLAFDEAKWDEGKHPRADDGKFGSGGGAKPHSMPQHAAAPPKAAQVSSTLTSVFTGAGFKKQKQPGPNGTVVYFHPESGAKVTVHPAPEGKKWSSKWSLSHPEKGEHEGEGSALAKLLGVVVQKAAEKKLVDEPKIIPEQDTEISKNIAEITKQGWNYNGQTEDGHLMFNGGKNGNGNALVYDPDTGVTDYYKSMEIAEEAKGKIVKNAVLSSELNEKVVSSAKVIKELGYKPADINGTTVIYTKDKAKLQYNAETGDWIAQTPGHMTKEGNGLPDLQVLLGGLGLPKTVKNSQQVIQTAAEKAAMTESQKAAAETAKKAQAKHAQMSATYTKLKDQAPQPTATQQGAIAKYSGSAYSKWNDQLRHDPSFAQKNPDTKHLDDYLMDATFDEEVTVYRKVDGEYAKILKSIIFEGTKFIDRGYVSTSANAGAWHGSFQFEITIPKGSKGAAIGKWSHHPSENEVLLPRNSAFVVTHYDPAKNVVRVTLDQAHL